jgi:cell wall-associated NlpC family hydrolase
LRQSLRAISLIAVFVGCAVNAAGAATKPGVHIVGPGETLTTIATREHRSTSELARINGLEGGGALRAGTALALDDASVAAIAPSVPYVITPEARADLRRVETASTMPTADADLDMWGAVRPASSVAKASAARKVDPIRRFARGIISRTSSIAMSLTRSAMRFIGTPYVFGGTSPNGFDCSGYTQHVFAMLGIPLPRTADAQFYAGRPTSGGLRAGDLVFFQTYEPGPSHVGIYLGGGRFIHSSSHGVMVSRLGDSYWSSRYLGAKRFIRSNRLIVASR